MKDKFKKIMSKLKKNEINVKHRQWIVSEDIIVGHQLPAMRVKLQILCWTTKTSS
jgi:hypothetical protein